MVMFTLFKNIIVLIIRSVCFWPHCWWRYYDEQCVMHRGLISGQRGKFVLLIFAVIFLKEWWMTMVHTWIQMDIVGNIKGCMKRVDDLRLVCVERTSWRRCYHVEAHNQKQDSGIDPDITQGFTFQSRRTGACASAESPQTAISAQRNQPSS